MSRLEVDTGQLVGSACRFSVASLSLLPRLVSSPWSRRGEPGKAENSSYVFSQLILVQNNPYAKVAYLDHSLNLSRAV